MSFEGVAVVLGHEADEFTSFGSMTAAEASDAKAAAQASGLKNIVNVNASKERDGSE